MGYDSTAGLENGFSLVNGVDLDVYFYPSKKVDLISLASGAGGNTTAVVLEPLGDGCKSDGRCSKQRCVKCTNEKVFLNLTAIGIQQCSSGIFLNPPGGYMRQLPPMGLVFEQKL